MADKRYEADDPLEPTAVALPANRETVAYMGRCFVEELARMGYRRNALLAFFRNPFYQGPHLVYRQLGEGFVRNLIEEEMAKKPAAGMAGANGKNCAGIDEDLQCLCGALASSAWKFHHDSYGAHGQAHSGVRSQRPSMTRGASAEAEQDA